MIDTAAQIFGYEHLICSTSMRHYGNQSPRIQDWELMWIDLKNT